MDKVRRFLIESLDIRGALVSIGPAWHEMQAGRQYPSAVAHLLGELVAATCLIATNLKSPGRLSFQLQGQGPMSLALVDCDAELRLRGMARHDLKVGADETAPVFEKLLGDGQLMLTLQSEKQAPYQSIVPLDGNSLAQALEHYLTRSEQQAAMLRLFADANHAAGLFLQKMPGADQKDPDGWNRTVQLATTIKATELRQPATKLLTQVFAEEDIRLFEPRPVSYHCPRDEEKIMAMLRNLGRDEVEAALAEHGEILIEDAVCNQRYRYGADIIETLFGQ